MDTDAAGRDTRIETVAGEDDVMVGHRTSTYGIKIRVDAGRRRDIVPVPLYAPRGSWNRVNKVALLVTDVTPQRSSLAGGRCVVSVQGEGNGGAASGGLTARARGTRA